MSGWDAYINALKGDGSVVTEGAIYGQGSPVALWATSSNFLTQDEANKLGSALANESAFNDMSGTGFTINGVKFMKVHSEVGTIIRGKKGEQSVAAAASGKVSIFHFYSY